MVNIALMSKFRKPIWPGFNVAFHGIASVAFLAVGILFTPTARFALSVVENDPYVPFIGTTTISSSGKPISVTSDNVNSCPAFSDCEAQDEWMHHAKTRAIEALVGCILLLLAL